MYYFDLKDLIRKYCFVLIFEVSYASKYENLLLTIALIHYAH